MLETKRFSLVKPTTQTPFHIDFNWWKQQDKNWHIYMNGLLCPEHQAALSNGGEIIMIDSIDPQTAEVTQVDGLQHLLITHCAKQPGFVTQNTSVVDAVFRLILANGNSPLTPEELGERINRPADTILRTISGTVVYKGIRPYHI